MLGRVFNASDAPLVRLRWYVTNLPFYEGQCVINNRIFDDEPYLQRPLGELPTWENEYKQDGARPAPAGLTGKHICHEEWLDEGEPYPNDLPPTVYGANGIPVCCGQFDDPPLGGIAVGGEAGDVWGGAPGPDCSTAFPAALYTTYPGTMTATAEQWWRWDTVPGYAYFFTTHVPFGGPAGWSLWTGPDCAHRTLFASGIAPVVNLPLFAPSTHVWASYTAVITPTAYDTRLDGPPVYLDPSVGGVEVGGQVGDEYRPPDDAEGGVEVGGEAGDVYSEPDPAAGGIEIGGEVGELFFGTDPSEGGLEIGGTVGDTYTPPGPGPTCATAFVGTIPIVYPNLILPGATQWYVWAVPAFTVKTVQVTTSGGGVVADYYFGFDCSTLNVWYTGAFNTQAGFSGAFSFLFVRIVNMSPVLVNYTIQVF